MRLIPALAAVTLLGACAPGKLEHPEALDFGTVAVGDNASAQLELRNTGGSALTLTFSVPASDFSLPLASLRLAPGAMAALQVRYLPTLPGPAEATLEVSAAGTVSHVTLRGRGVASRSDVGWPTRALPTAEGCMVATSTLLDFGTALQTCGPRALRLWLSNSCGGLVTVTGAQVLPGSSAFEVVGNSWPRFLALGGPPALVEVSFSPAHPGPSSAVLAVDSSAGKLLVDLRGFSNAAGPNVDTFHVPPLPQVEVLVMVDGSASFVSKRAGVRTNLEGLLTWAATACVDSRWSFAAAEGAPDAGPALLATDAGVTAFSSGDAAFVTLALTAFDALPLGSEVESCVGPAVQLLGARDAGTRASSVICISDALDQTANVPAELAKVPLATWSAVSATATPSCAVEAADDGTWAALAATHNGVAADICAATWWQSFLPLGQIATPCTPSTFYLTNLAGGAPEVRVDGQLIASLDSTGATVWTYEATSNAVVFAPGHEPGPGAVVEASYPPSCGP